MIKRKADRVEQVCPLALQFGIVNHGRPGVVYEEIGGYQVDRALLDLMLESRT